ncbi:hypothetical protein V8C35DRAFT_279705 [Trichoderma chlorosporum]
MSEIPDAVYVTTTITVYDGTVTPTDSIEPSTSSSAGPSSSSTPLHTPVHLPPSVFIPLPRPSKDISSLSSQLSTLTTKTIPQTSPTNSLSSSITTATSSTSAAPAFKQSETPSSPQSTERKVSIGEIVGIVIGIIVLFGFILLMFVVSRGSSRCSRSRRRKMRNGKEESRKETDEHLQKQKAAAEEETMPAELDASTEFRGYPATMHSVRELDGSSTAPHNQLSTSQLPIELPTSADPGNSPLPRYEDLDIDWGRREFSWAAPESAYRPDKLGLENDI